MNQFQKFLKRFWPETILFATAFVFSSWLMWHTFSYQNHTFYIAAKAWSDFAAHLPLIRSFSWGQNFPPEYPLFPGEPIHYHFLFYALVGFLERLGLSIDWALNFPSALAFLGLILALYFLAKLLFKSRFVSFLSVILFLFNGSFAFLEFFKNHHLSLRTPIEIFQNNTFPSFGPYDGKIVSAFWNLNIYTNQRHLALAFGLILLAFILILKSLTQNQTITLRRAVFIGFFLGLIPFIHSAGFVMAIVVFAGLSLIFKNQWRALLTIVLIAAALGFPQIFLAQGADATRNFRFNPGYLIAGRLTLANFLTYWFLNLGLSFFLIPLGLAKANSLAKGVFLAFCPLFIIGNLFQFSPEMAANHKFFNLFLIIGNIFVASAVFLIWQKKIFGKILAMVIIFFLTLSGIIDFFPIKNDSSLTIDDFPKNPDITWIKEKTPPKSVFLNSSYLYHPASLAGRKIFLGWPYFAWSAGYDTDQRGKIMKAIYENKDKNKICQLLTNNKIDYLITEDTRGDKNLPEIDLESFQTTFEPVYSNPKNNFQIYEVKSNCSI